MQTVSDDRVELDAKNEIRRYRSRGKCLRCGAMYRVWSEHMLRCGDMGGEG